MSDVTRYRWSRAVGLRIAGLAAICLALFWMVAAFAGFAWWSDLLLLLATLLAIGCIVRFVCVPPLLLEVSSHGYRLVNVRGGGVPSAGWAEVESVATGRQDSSFVMQVTLSGGRSTSVPVSLLGAQSVAAEREMHSRLNAAFGYRRLHGT
jgi:hypothetical protein